MSVANQNQREIPVAVPVQPLAMGSEAMSALLKAEPPTDLPFSFNPNDYDLKKLVGSSIVIDFRKKTVTVGGNVEAYYNFNAPVDFSRICWFKTWGNIEYVDPQREMDFLFEPDIESRIYPIIRTWIDARMNRAWRHTWIFVRRVRNARIAEVEWMVERLRQQQDLELTGRRNMKPQGHDDHGALLEYIQALRDVPQQTCEPEDVTWPEIKIGNQTYGGPITPHKGV